MRWGPVFAERKEVWEGKLRLENYISDSLSCQQTLLGIVPSGGSLSLRVKDFSASTDRGESESLDGGMEHGVLALDTAQDLPLYSL